MLGVAALISGAGGVPSIVAQGPPAEPAKTDLYGDPLPAGAIARLGTLRFRPCHCFAFSPDGAVIAGADSQSIHLWETATGKEIRRLPLKIEDISCLCFSPDGQRLAALHQVGIMIEVWDLKQVKRLFQVGVAGRGGGTVLKSARMAFSADGKTVYAGNDQTVHGWDSATGKEVFHVRHAKDTERASAVVLSEDQKIFATVFGSLIRIWDRRSGRLLHVCEGKEKRGVSRLALSRDGRLLAATDVNGNEGWVRLWDTRTGKEVRALGGDRTAVGSVAFSPNGKILASATPYWWSSSLGRGKEGIRIWNLANDKEPAKVFPATRVGDIEFSPDGKLLGWISCHKSIHLLDWTSGKEHVPFASHQGMVSSVAFTPDGKLAATASDDYTIRLWDPLTGKQQRVLSGHAGPVYAIAFSADGKRLASASGDRQAAVWEMATGKMRLLGEVHGGWVQAVAFAPNGKTLVTGCHTGEIHFWNVETGQEICQVEVDGRYYLSAVALAFSPDGKLLVSGVGKVVRWHDAATGGVLRMQDLGTQVTSLHFSPEGRSLAIGCDGKVVVLEMATGKERARPSNGYGSVAFSPDGRLLASGSQGGDTDKEIQLWELATGKEVGTFGGHQGSVWSVAFSPDSKRLITGGLDATALIWDLAAVAKANPVAGSRPEEKPLSPKELDAAWADLGGEDAARAYRAVWRLVLEAKTAIPFFRRQLQPAPPLDERKLAAWIADFDDERFETRERASAEIARLGKPAEAALRKKLAEKRSPEAHRRINMLLARLANPLAVPTPEEIRLLRAVEALEHIGNSDAKAFLAELAAGPPGARLTREATAALARLGVK
jgi:WD40 repeat protein